MRTATGTAFAPGDPRLLQIKNRAVATLLGPYDPEAYRGHKGRRDAAQDVLDLVYTLMLFGPEDFGRSVDGRTRGERASKALTIV